MHKGLRYAVCRLQAHMRRVPGLLRTAHAGVHTAQGGVRCGGGGKSGLQRGAAIHNEESAKKKTEKGEKIMAELKCCPFCGGKAYMKITPHIPAGHDYTPQCLAPSCCGRITKKWTDRETAEYAWNRRTNNGKL